jgi:hypothetical protein
VNAERAAMQSPEFKGKMMRTRKEELSVIVKKCLQSRKTLGDVSLFDTLRSKTKRDPTSQ